MSENSYYNKLLNNNKEWVSHKLAEDKDYFTRLASLQKPPVLWIGCADSRVPANEITGTKSGEMFVHRNIANMVVHTDINMLSVLDYAVNQLKVKHIIVCGHYGCGGVEAAMHSKSLGLIDKWVRNIKEVYKKNKVELERIPTEEGRFDRLVELNVKDQVYDLAKTSIVQKAWKANQDLELHGWVYGLKDGLIKDLKVNMDSPEHLDSIYILDFD
ncbi:carbonate dehydratase [Tamlana sp. 2_MG-2023]|uniref:carbonate dehydratase n=1 Tax=unclassified Tamlana TaxID=2614803 RepID=UPI0026E18CDC|nr:MULTISPECIES: carbonate dehydratase [unclassified Tamlana]MDO6759942.1 carbonate dehydratase [Tamlana sp. 2_MG-2023]MDO6791888.1 carbonate dehydratase [Tamlana sp. 1_MG-2023]